MDKSKHQMIFWSYRREKSLPLDLWVKVRALLNPSDPRVLAPPTFPPRSTSVSFWLFLAMRFRRAPRDLKSPRHQQPLMAVKIFPPGGSHFSLPVRARFG